MDATRAAPRLDLPQVGPTAGATPNQVTSQSPAGERAMEAQRAGELAQMELQRAQVERARREREALAEEQRRQEQITRDRLELVGPAIDWYVGQLVRQPCMADVAPRTGAEMGAVLGAIYGLVTSTARDKPVTDVVNRTLGYGAIGCGVGWVGGHGVRSVARMQPPQVPRRMPLDVQRRVRQRLPGMEPWRWQALHETWAELADEHNGSRGPGLGELVQTAGALRALKP